MDVTIHSTHNMIWFTHFFVHDTKWVPDKLWLNTMIFCLWELCRIPLSTVMVRLQSCMYSHVCYVFGKASKSKVCPLWVSVNFYFFFIHASRPQVFHSAQLQTRGDHHTSAKVKTSECSSTSLVLRTSLSPSISVNSVGTVDDCRRYCGALPGFSCVSFRRFQSIAADFQYLCRHVNQCIWSWYASASISDALHWKL